MVAECLSLAQIRDSSIAINVGPIADKLGIEIPLDNHELCCFMLNGSSTIKIAKFNPASVETSFSVTYSKLLKACSTLCLKLHLKCHGTDCKPAMTGGSMLSRKLQSLSSLPGHMVAEFDP